jgi:hypothetical protein
MVRDVKPGPPIHMDWGPWLLGKDYASFGSVPNAIFEA